jgi:signal peptidase I
VFNKWRKYSYAAQKHQRHRLTYVLIWTLSIFGAYALVSNFILTTVVLQNETMRPGLVAGDRFILNPFGLHWAFHSLVGGDDQHGLPFKRGALVLVNTADPARKTNAIVGAAASMLRFFSLQQINFQGQDARLYLKRVIGLPGDEISMTDYVLKIKSRDDPYALTEFEVAARPYDVLIPQTPALWDESLPFSGTMPPRILAADECFVVSDDRSVTSDSRTWGPVTIRSIVGKCLFRYWPISRIGVP